MESLDKAVRTELVRINQRMCEVEAQVRSEDTEWAQVQNLVDEVTDRAVLLKQLAGEAELLS